MNDFQYSAPHDLAEATELLAEYGDRAQILAGGTDIIVQLREGHRDADMVIDIKQIPELTEMEFSADNGLRLGASVSCFRIYEDPAVSRAYPALADSTNIIGGWQIQSRASVGGNLCNSSPAADTIPSLIAHGVTCRIAGPEGERTVTAENFCTAPGRNVLADGELLVDLRFPPPQPRASSAYQRFIPRNEMDIAVAGAGSYLELEDDGETIKAARIALAAVAATPQFAAAASESLVGKPANDESFAAAGELAKEVASPITDMRGTVEYRIHLSSVLTRRTLATALARIKEN